jgi:hypothetical protein
LRFRDERVQLREELQFGGAPRGAGLFGAGAYLQSVEDQGEDQRSDRRDRRNVTETGPALTL